MPKAKKKFNKNMFWDEPVISAAMRTYRLAHTVTKTEVPGQQRKNIDIVLNNPDDGASLQHLYRTVIYPAHERLAQSYLSYRSVDRDHKEEMMGDVLTYLYEVMMLYWDPLKPTSSYSYFASAISTRIAHYYKGTLASSPQWTREKDYEFVLREIRPEEGKLEAARDELIQYFNEFDMEEGLHYEIKTSHRGKKIKAVNYRRTHRHHLDEGDDIVQTSDIELWEDICLKTLSEYVPDVVIAQKYHHLAFAVLEIVKEVINQTYSKNCASRIDFWLLSRVQLQVGWAVTRPDLKMAFYVIRTALGYYLEDFPLQSEAEYGDCNLIKAKDD